MGVAQHEKERDSSSKETARVKAATDARSAEINAKIAVAQAKQASSQEATKQIKIEIKEIHQDTTDRSLRIAKAKAQRFKQDKTLHELQKRVGVLKAFLTGPMLMDDAPSS